MADDFCSNPFFRTSLYCRGREIRRPRGISSDEVNNLLNEVSTWVQCPKEAKAVKEAAKAAEKLNSLWDDADWDDTKAGLQTVGGFFAGLGCVVTTGGAGAVFCVGGAGLVMVDGSISEKKAGNAKDRLWEESWDANETLVDAIKRLCQCLDKHKPR